MKIRTMLGLAVIGGAAYAHKQRGGEFTVESIKQSLDELWQGIQRKARPIAEEAQEKLRDAANVVSSGSETTTQQGTETESTGYGYRR